MFDWLRRVLDIAGRVVPNAITDVIDFTLSGLGGIIGSLSNNVADAWHELAIGLDVLRSGNFDFTGGLLGTLERIILHWIPRYAITAWWWVTHPESMAEQLLLYVVHWLEQRSWQIAPYLGKFVLALIVRNIRRILPLVESIITAVL